MMKSSERCNGDVAGFYYEYGKRKVTLMTNELIPTRLIKQYQPVLYRPAYQLDNGQMVMVTPRVAMMLTEQGVLLSHKAPLIVNGWHKLLSRECLTIGVTSGRIFLQS